MADAPDQVREKVMSEIGTAQQSAAPLTSEKVGNLLWQAKEEAKSAAIAAKKSPAQKAKEKARHAKEQRENENRAIEFGKREAEQKRANVALAELLLERFGGDGSVLVEALEKSSFTHLRSRLTDALYAQQWHAAAMASRARTKAEWLEYLALREEGKNPERL